MLRGTVMRINVVSTATTGSPANGPVIVSPALTAIQYELPDGGNGRRWPAHGTARSGGPGRYRYRRVSAGSLLRDRRAPRLQPGDGYPERRAGHVVQSRVVEEVRRGGDRVRAGGPPRGTARP
jgi:hypothetical protein